MSGLTRILKKFGIALYHLGKYQEALSALDIAIELKPEFNLAWISKKIALKLLGRTKEAKKVFKKSKKFETRF